VEFPPHSPDLIPTWHTEELGVCQKTHKNETTWSCYNFCTVTCSSSHFYSLALMVGILNNSNEQFGISILPFLLAIVVLF